MLTDEQIAERRSQTNCEIDGCDGAHIPNVPLMRKILDRIREDPNSWWQATWAIGPGDSLLGENMRVMGYDPKLDLVFETDIVRELEVRNGVCETAFCIAGHASMLSEDPLIWNQDTMMFDNATVSGYEPSERGQHELGLTDHEADVLFEGDNTWKDVKRMLTEYAAIVGDTI